MVEGLGGSGFRVGLMRILTFVAVGRSVCSEYALTHGFCLLLALRFSQQNVLGVWDFIPDTPFNPKP